VKKKLLYVVLAIPVLLLGAMVVLANMADRPVTAPTPPIKADTSPEAVARGAAIFHSMCESCHRSPGSERVSGNHMAEVPAFLGKIYASNITLHPTAGIGKLKDEDIARVIRYGVTHDNRMTLMASSAMADSDVAAVIGFIRSGDPLFEPDPNVPPRTEVSFVGKVVLMLAGGMSPPDRPASGIALPPRTDKVAYGRYLAHDVLDCAGCHTPGFDAAKVDGPEVFSGGFEFPDGNGGTMIAPNITFHETGIGKWTLADFTTAVENGLRPNGAGVLRFPMPRFRGFAPEEMEALYEYLKSKPALPSKAQVAQSTP
jgi:mono/diheme cytochrome c family protein